MFELKQSALKGCCLVEFKRLDDLRGSFTKTFHADLFKQLGIEMAFREEYFTWSQKNVFRGLHFQNPPKAIAKMVICLHGKVSDYVVDIRQNSPTYGQFEVFELDGEKPAMVYVPEGFAHGFYVKSEAALMQYKVSDVFDAVCDSGIHYSSFDFAASIKNPILSERDKGFIDFKNYQSPFRYQP